jgi:hypothetical protein
VRSFVTPSGDERNRSTPAVRLKGRSAKHPGGLLAIGLLVGADYKLSAAERRPTPERPHGARPVLAQISTGLRRLEIFAGQPYRHGMGTILFAVVSIFAFRFRSRASLELKLIALQHQSAARSASAFISRPAAVGVALPDLAAGHRRDDIGQAGDRGPMAS